jgi:hypothetical protein
LWTLTATWIDATTHIRLASILILKELLELVWSLRVLGLVIFNASLMLIVIACWAAPYFRLSIFPAFPSWCLLRYYHPNARNLRGIILINSCGIKLTLDLFFILKVLLVLLMLLQGYYLLFSIYCRLFLLIHVFLIFQVKLILERRGLSWRLKVLLRLLFFF